MSVNKTNSSKTPHLWYFNRVKGFCLRHSAKPSEKYFVTLFRTNLIPFGEIFQHLFYKVFICFHLWCHAWRTGQVNVVSLSFSCLNKTKKNSERTGVCHEFTFFSEQTFNFQIFIVIKSNQKKEKKGRHPEGVKLLANNSNNTKLKRIKSIIFTCCRILSNSLCWIGK